MKHRRHYLWGTLLLLLVACEAEGPGAPLDGSGEIEQALEAPTVPTVGLDDDRLTQAFAEAADLPRLHCLVVARHGVIQGEECFRGPGLDEYANVKSVSKSVLSALVGIAIEEGHLEGVDEPIVPYFSGYLQGDTSTARASITVGHLLSMQSGLERTSGSNYGRWVQSPNWVRFAITRPMESQPGTTRSYSTGNSHLLSAILTSATGESTWAYARSVLAEPLGIELPRWLADPQGIYFGGNEMRMTPRAMVRFGELYRNRGRSADEQIVPAAWVEESLAPRARSRFGGGGYGYGWFVTAVNDYPMFYAWGYGGQYIFVVPELELTVVTTSNPVDPRTRGHNQGIMRILREWIVPAAELGAS